MTSNRWLTRWPSSAPPQLRLICFPYAGGGASLFRDWAAQRLPADVEVCAVQLPGRENRISESPYSALPDLLPALTEALAEATDLPYVMFGYSLGATISFEFARRQRETGGRLPEHLIVGACRPPQLPRRGPAIHALPEQQFLAAVQGIGGTDPRLFALPEMLALVLPLLRADFSISETYQYRPGPPLPFPITVLAGSTDTLVPPEAAQEWTAQTSGPTTVRTFDGGHFFLRTHQDPVLEEVTEILAGVRTDRT